MAPENLVRAAKRPPARQQVPWRRAAAGTVDNAMPPVHSFCPGHALRPTQCRATTHRQAKHSVLALMLARSPVARARRGPGRPAADRYAARTTRSGPPGRRLGTLCATHSCSRATWPPRAACTAQAFCAGDMMSNPRSAVTKVLSKAWSSGMGASSLPPCPLKIPSIFCGPAAE